MQHNLDLRGVAKEIGMSYDTLLVYQCRRGKPLLPYLCFGNNRKRYNLNNVQFAIERINRLRRATNIKLSALRQFLSEQNDTYRELMQRADESDPKYKEQAHSIALDDNKAA